MYPRVGSFDNKFLEAQFPVIKRAQRIPFPHSFLKVKIKWNSNTPYSIQRFQGHCNVNES